MAVNICVSLLADATYALMVIWLWAGVIQVLFVGLGEYVASSAITGSAEVVVIAVFWECYCAEC